MAITNRKKGHDFERQVVLGFRTHGFPNAKRHDESVPNAVLGYDLENTGPFLVQCKCLTHYAPISAIFELPATSKVPLLITQSDDGPAMAVLPFASLLQMITGRLAAREDF